MRCSDPGGATGKAEFRVVGSQVGYQHDEILEAPMVEVPAWWPK
jgi:hypothetical protein